MTALLPSRRPANRRARRALIMSDKFALSDTMHFIEETRRNDRPNRPKRPPERPLPRRGRRRIRARAAFPLTSRPPKQYS